MKANFVGFDSWERPVYKCENGIYVKDVDPRASSPADLCTCVNNDPDGEPDEPVCVKKIELIPQRMVW